MKKLFYLVLAFVLLSGLETFAKDVKIKFGDVNREEIEMQIYQPDTSAHAVVLLEKGDAHFELDGPQGPVYKYNVLKRIKILTKEGLDNANISISTYSHSGSEEDLGSVKGFTYNIEDGKVVKTKLEKSSIHKETTSDYYETTKITFPNVKPGSVIELKYSISSNLFWNLRGWNFQYDIPVQESEFQIDIPEYFIYKTHLKGYESLTTSTADKISRTEFNYNRYFWNALKMPAFKSEPFMLGKRSFISALEFELSSINIPGSVYKDYSSTWAIVKEKMLEPNGIGEELSGGGYLKDAVEEIEANNTDNLSKTIAAFKYIRDNIKWNERYSTYTSSSLRKAFNEKEGNCTDINLMLTVLLKKLGIESHPVLLCSRGKGLFNKFLVKRSSFDYMITTAYIDGKEILLDATDRVSNCGDLPFRCLNSQGLKIAPGEVTWINLNTARATKQIMCAINLQDIDDITGTVNYKYANYSAYMHRKQVEDKNEDEIIEEFETDNDWLTVNDFTKKESEGNGQIALVYDCEISNCVEQNGDRLYINPLIVERQKSNPFTLTERKYPVDFGYAHKEDIIISLMCPEGYEIETMPESLRVTLPEGAGSFTYAVQKNGPTIQLISRIDIKKPVFIYGEYQFLKEFYNKIVSKQSEMIVLKKLS
uniref:DUF3857 domain-containing protein n=1 Tax=uncultured Draconibacterium sp. TaxID=1573823 RepID=UPI003217DB5C